MTPDYLREPGEWNDEAFALTLGIIVGPALVVLWLCVIAAFLSEH
jgi:hypothetical protein